MNTRFYKILSFTLLAILIGYVFYFSFTKTPQTQNETQNNNTGTTTTQTTTDKIEYKNTEYGFTFTLPKSWLDYTTIEDQWSGDSANAKGEVQMGTEHGPLVSIRHPDWDYKSPRQDIPIMVFTKQQWNDLQNDVFHIGAAPINPTEIGRNAIYVFAIPARYNFAYLTGYEEVDQIIRGNNFKAF